MTDLDLCVLILREKFARLGREAAIGVRPDGKALVFYAKVGAEWRTRNIPRNFFRIPIGY
jgi:hypothetical protein